jgi:hypothetical protein
MAVRRACYRFTVRLRAPRAWAYRWLTDYRPDDLHSIGQNADRVVEKLADDLFLLTDEYRADPFDARQGARTVKAKLVQLYPKEWMWVSTHVSGPARYSQFRYELFPRGRTSCTLRFTGVQVEKVARRPTARSLAERSRVLRREDSAGWRRYAAAVAREYRRSARSRK